MLHMEKRSMTRTLEEVEQEREELRRMMEVMEARNRRMESMLLAIAKKVGVRSDAIPNLEGCNEGTSFQQSFGEWQLDITELRNRLREFNESRQKKERERRVLEASLRASEIAAEAKQEVAGASRENSESASDIDSAAGEAIQKLNLETEVKTEMMEKHVEDGTGMFVLVPSMAEIRKRNLRRVKEDGFTIWPQTVEIGFDGSRIPELGVKGSKILPFQHIGAIGMESRAGANATMTEATMRPPRKLPLASFCRPEKALRPSAKPPNNEALRATSTTEMIVTCRQKRGEEETERAPFQSRWAAERPPSKPPDFAVRGSGSWVFMPLVLWCCEGGGAIVTFLCFTSAKNLLQGPLRVDTRQVEKVEFCHT